MIRTQRRRYVASLLALVAAAVMTLVPAATAAAAEYETYPEMRKHLGELVAAEKFAEAAKLLERSVDRFPDNLVANSYNLAYVYGRLGKTREGVRALSRALDRGVWFGIWAFDGPAWDPYRPVAAFGKVLERNDRARLEAQKDARMTVEVAVPGGYDPAKKYPLFLALHGGGENVAEFKPHWMSERLGREFLVAYVQSSQMATMTGFHWEDAGIAARELTQALEEIRAKHAVDDERIFVGGFSSGGHAALLLALKGTLPVRGFVSLCPRAPDALTDEDLAAAKVRGARGTILTTEFDGRIPQQRAFADRLRAAGVQYQFRVSPDTGHWYPDDLGPRIDQALDHIEGR